MEQYVSTALVKLYCRISKLGWNAGTGMNEVIQSVNRFLQGTVAHKIIGTEIYSELVQEIDTPAHRINNIMF